MKIEGTPQEINTIRAALRAHDDRIIDAMRESRRRKDDEHITFLKVEQRNLREALRAIGYAYAEGV